VSETLGNEASAAPSRNGGTDARGTADLDGRREWRGHVIVCGLQAVGVRTVEQLHLAGAEVVVIDDETVSERQASIVRNWQIPIVERRGSLDDALFEARVAEAEAVIVIESTDLRTLETVLLVHDLRADVRLVAHLDNPAVARAVEEISGVATVLDVATLFAPSVIEACLKRRAHDIAIGATDFVTPRSRCHTTRPCVSCMAAWCRWGSSATPSRTRSSAPGVTCASTPEIA